MKIHLLQLFALLLLLYCVEALTAKVLLYTMIQNYLTA